MSVPAKKLNLRPGERRLVVGIGIILFIVVQFVFVLPHFGDVKKLNTRRDKALEKLKTYQGEIGQTNKFVGELKKLESEGWAVPPEDQSAELLRAIQTQAVQTRVQIQNTTKPVTRTNNLYFLEQSQQIGILAEEGALVSFLYNLGEGNSLIRVRDLNVRPDPSHTRLSGTIKLVASYQKKAPVRSAPASAAASPASSATKAVPAKVNRPPAPSSESRPAPGAPPKPAPSLPNRKQP